MSLFNMRTSEAIVWKALLELSEGSQYILQPGYFLQAVNLEINVAYDTNYKNGTQEMRAVHVK